jgi:peptide deformylase
MPNAITKHSCDIACRQMLLFGVAFLSACATSRAFESSPEEKILLAQRRPDFELVTVKSPSAAILRQRAREVPLNLELGRLAPRLKTTLEKSGGVGLAGPQVGLSLRIVLVIIDPRSSHPRVILARNPIIVERSTDVVPSYEACLSIPDVGGLVLRQRWVRIRFVDEAGHTEELSANGFNGFIWQHELDHLDGVLYTDRLQGELVSLDEMRKRRKALEANHPK